METNELNVKDLYNRIKNTGLTLIDGKWVSILYLEPKYIVFLEHLVKDAITDEIHKISEDK